MSLEMKPQCGTCATELRLDGPAFICSYECSYCAECAEKTSRICPNCSGELVPRPRRDTSS
jgi:hypothetical protein